MLATTEATLSSEEFAGLLTHFGVDLPAGSPLGRPRLALDGKTAAGALQAKVGLNGDWQTAVRLLGAGERQIIIERAALGDSETLCFYPSASAPGDLVGVLVTKTLDGDYRIKIQLALAKLLIEAFDPLEPTQSAPPIAFDRAFTRAGLTVLAAAIDYIRMLYAATLLERRGIAVVLLTQDNLEQQVFQGISTADRRCLVTLLRGFLPEVPVKPTEFTAGLTEMVSAGLLLPNGENTFFAGGELLEMAVNLLSPVPALMIGRNRSSSAGVWSIILRGNSLWQLRPASDAAAGTVRVQSIDGLTAMSEALSLMGELAGSRITSPRPSKAAHSDQQTLPHASGAENKRFCARCGAALRQGAAFCTMCGVQVA